MPRRLATVVFTVSEFSGWCTWWWEHCEGVISFSAFRTRHSNISRVVPKHAEWGWIWQAAVANSQTTRQRRHWELRHRCFAVCVFTNHIYLAALCVSLFGRGTSLHVLCGTSTSQPIRCCISVASRKRRRGFEIGAQNLQTNKQTRAISRICWHTQVPGTCGNDKQPIVIAVIISAHRSVFP